MIALTAAAALALAAPAPAPAPAGRAPAQATARAAPAAQGLPFVVDDYQKALAQARARNVPLVVDVWAPW
ncbi:MAG TPA: hypothetical protein VFM45_08960 [Anaeromyxobacteraceae bacterium]|nr:hypothetical protein [Anaeromyxobacteraceae bacterium]